ncbi:porin [Acidisoma cellulosilytica]|uniref:Porin n=1 Tax=Acidisoma cellulosilyticum TaxID=2802395 RepID=A0A963YYX0_9PROT|nr:porin [Acidisoma cellulosilyticum]MCB8879595.1 porin [Acidisoma cellulosilyticum]
MKKILMATSAIGVTSLLTLGAAFAQTAAPGSVTVHLNGRINWYAGIEGSSLDSVNGTKTATDSFYGYMRLYPGFDGVAANGLHYGASTQIRMNFESSASAETLYVFQAYGYLGTPELGQVSFGQQNGPTVLFETGTFEGFNDGAWFGDLPVIIPENAEVIYPFVDTGYNQTSDKLVYLSPTIAGFQFAFGFTPNNTGMNYSPALTSVDTTVLGGTPKNLLDIGGQYTQTFGPVGIQVGADYQYAGQVAGTNAQTAGYQTPTGYKNLSIFSGGATATISGVTFGGNVVYGDYNEVSGYSFQMEPDGGQAAIGWLAGAQYTKGPLTFGASYFGFNTTGDLPGGVDDGGTVTAAGLTTGQQMDAGFAAGATYTLVPGVNLFLDYDWGWRHQGGLDFSNGNAGTQHNTVQSQLFGVGTQIQW